MELARILRHLLTTPLAVRRRFPASALATIEREITAGERLHDGEVRFAVEHSLEPGDLFRGTSARDRALAVFSKLRVWDTERNNGVLVYVLLADRNVEIVADRGIHAKVGDLGWEGICREMEALFGRGEFEAGAVAGIRAASALLARHFPPTPAPVNEQPDRPDVL